MSKQGQPSSWLNDPWSSLWTWIIAFVLIAACFFIVDQTFGEVEGLIGLKGYYQLHSITWAPIATVILVFNMVSAALLRPYIKRHGRNYIAWTTAIIVFTPILMGLGYLLMWPKNQQ